MATRIIDDTKLNSIAVAIQSKDGGGQMTVDQMPDRIATLPALDPALVLWDWDGTKLAEYSKTAALALTELPTPGTLPPYSGADHELLVFQSWNWSLANIKAWIQSHEGERLDVGAVYTTTDGQDHNYWENPRLSGAGKINMQKRGQTSVGDNAFLNCYSLKKISLPRGAANIGSNAFNGCSSLKQVNIPGSVTNIGANAFQNCYSLEQINIPEGLVSIRYYVFHSCYSLEQIVIPDSVISIGESAFNSCYSLKQINIPDNVTNISINAFQNCYSLTEVSLPDDLTTIGGNVFYSCYSLRKINLPDSLTTIKYNTFQNCYSLEKIIIPDSVTSIGESAFNSCYSLAQINIPGSVTYIGGAAFRYSNTLTDILNESQASISNVNAFDGLPSDYRIYVPRANLSWFETATNWSTIYTQGHIVAIEDYIDYLESIGFNVDKYKGETA